MKKFKNLQKILLAFALCFVVLTGVAAFATFNIKTKTIAAAQSLTFGTEDQQGDGYTYDAQTNTLYLTDFNGTSLAFAKENAKIVIEGRSTLTLNTNNNPKAGTTSAIAIYAAQNITICGEGVLIVNMDMQADTDEDTTGWIIAAVYAETGVTISQKTDIRFSVSSENSPAIGVCTNAGEINIYQDYVDPNEYLPDGVDWEDVNHITMNGNQDHIAILNRAKNHNIQNNGNIHVRATNNVVLSLNLPDRGIGILSDDGQDETSPNVFHNTSGKIEIETNLSGDDPYSELYIYNFSQGIVNKSQERSTAEADIFIDYYIAVWSEVEGSVGLISAHNGIKLDSYIGETQTDGPQIDLSGSESLYGVKISNSSSLYSQNDYAIKMNNHNPKGIAVVSVELKNTEYACNFITYSSDETIKSRVIDGYVRWNDCAEGISLCYAKAGVVAPTNPTSYALSSDSGQAQFLKQYIYINSGTHIFKLNKETQKYIKINSQGFDFAETLTGEWITNLPAGLTQTLSRSSSTGVSIKLSGTPTQVMNETIKIKIPTSNFVGYNSSEEYWEFESENKKFVVEEQYSMSMITSSLESYTGLRSFTPGETITITMTVKQLYRFSTPYYQNKTTSERIYFEVEGDPAERTKTFSFVAPASDILITPGAIQWGYNITTHQTTGGIVNMGYTHAVPSSLVQLSYKPDPGYTFRGGYYILNGTRYEAEGTSFTMPNGDIDYYPIWEPSYFVVSIADSQNGKISADKTSVVYNELITISIENVDIGYRLSRLYYKVNSTKYDISLKNMTFNMPAASVTVYAEFNTPTYNIDVSATSGFEAILNTTLAVEGETIYLLNDFEALGMRLVKISYTKASDGTTVDLGATDSFVMPAYNISLVVEVEYIDYNIETKSIGATFEIASSGNKGNTILISNISGRVGYSNQIKSIYFVNKTTGETTQIDKTALSFEMPNSNVLVVVELEQLTYTIIVDENANISIIGEENLDGDLVNYDSPISLEVGEHTIRYYQILEFFDNPEPNLTLEYILNNDTDIPCAAQRAAHELYQLCNIDRFEFTTLLYVVSYKFLVEENDFATIVATNKYGNAVKNGDWVSYLDKITFEVQLKDGHKLLQVLLNNNPLVASENGTYTFDVNEQDNTIVIETKKIGYNISIPSQVTVVRGAETLTNDSLVYAGDILKISFDMPAYCSTVVLVNGKNIDNGKTIEVEAEDIEISFSQEQIMWQVWFENTSNYTIIAFAGSTRILSGSWVLKGSNISIEVVSVIGQSYSFAKINGQETDLTNGYLMQDFDITISAQTEYIDYEVSKGAFTKGSFGVSKDTAHYSDEICVVDVVCNLGYRVLKMYYVLNGQRVEFQNNKFLMPAGNVEVCVEFEKIPYSIFIPENVFVMKDGILLSSGDTVFVGDKLELYYLVQAHFEAKVFVNGVQKQNGESFVVGAGNVVIVYTEEQVEWIVLFENSENYNIDILYEGEKIESGVYLRAGSNLEIVVRPADKYILDKIIINNASVKIENGKYIMPAENIFVSATVEYNSMTIATDDNFVIVVGEKTALKNLRVEIVYIESNSNEHKELEGKIANVHMMFAFKIRLVDRYTNQEVKPTAAMKVYVAIPHEWNIESTDLYRASSNMITKIKHQPEMVNNKTYATFNTTQLETFAFAQIGGPKKKADKTMLVVCILVVVLALIIGVTAIVGFEKKDKNKPDPNKPDKSKSDKNKEETSNASTQTNLKASAAAEAQANKSSDVKKASDSKTNKTAEKVVEKPAEKTAEKVAEKPAKAATKTTAKTVATTTAAKSAKTNSKSPAAKQTSKTATTNLASKATKTTTDKKPVQSKTKATQKSATKKSDSAK